MLRHIYDYEKFLETWRAAEQEYEEHVEMEVIHNVVTVITESPKLISDSTDEDIVKREVMDIIINNIKAIYNDSRDCAIDNIERRAWEDFNRDPQKAIDACVEHVVRHNKQLEDGDPSAHSE